MQHLKMRAPACFARTKKRIGRAFHEETAKAKFLYDSVFPVRLQRFRLFLCPTPAPDAIGAAFARCSRSLAATDLEGLALECLDSLSLLLILSVSGVAHVSFRLKFHNVACS